jgi:hypothetical protein
MPTENPKISAYVPKVVYDRFKEFQEDRQLSMSQAAIELFADYFGIDLSISALKTTGGLQSRLEGLANEVEELKSFITNLAIQVDQIQSTSSLSKDILECAENLPEDLSHVNELPENLAVAASILGDEVQSELPANDKNICTDNDTLLELKPSPLFELQSELPSDIPFQDIDRSIAPLKTSKISERFGLSYPMLSKVSKYSIDKQIKYTASKDLEQRPWVYSPSKKLFYPLRKPE